MPILQINDRIDLDRPSLVLAMSGWVDGGMVATRVGEHLRGLGRVVAEFRADDIYDYQSNRPTLELTEGVTADIHFPALTISALSTVGADILVVSGTEPSSKWHAIAAELAELSASADVKGVIAVGAVPAMVAHTRPTPIMTTSTDPGLEPSGIPGGRLVVPAALVNVLGNHVSQSNGIPEVGFWAQIPHYVSGAYWPGVEALLTRMSGYLGVDAGIEAISAHARDMIARLDAAVANKPEAEQFIKELEDATPAFPMDETISLTDEIEDFLKSLGGEV